MATRSYAFSGGKEGCHGRLEVAAEEPVVALVEVHVVVVEAEELVVEVAGVRSRRSPDFAMEVFVAAAELDLRMDSCVDCRLVTHTLLSQALEGCHCSGCECYLA